MQSLDGAVSLPLQSDDILEGDLQGNTINETNNIEELVNCGLTTEITEELAKGNLKR